MAYSDSIQLAVFCHGHILREVLPDARNENGGDVGNLYHLWIQRRGSMNCDIRNVWGIKLLAEDQMKGSENFVKEC